MHTDAKGQLCLNADEATHITFHLLDMFNRGDYALSEWEQEFLDGIARILCCGKCIELTQAQSKTLLAMQAKSILAKLIDPKLAAAAKERATKAPDEAPEVERSKAKLAKDKPFVVQVEAMVVLRYEVDPKGAEEFGVEQAKTLKGYLEDFLKKNAKPEGLLSESFVCKPTVRINPTIPR